MSDGGMMDTVFDTLDHLIGFNTVSSKSNLDLISYLEAFCTNLGAETQRIYGKTQEKCGLIAHFGPHVEGGIILSGHTDVVPTEGQNWTRPDFRLTREDDRFYGRGTTDMKGFLACMLSAAQKSTQHKLQRPLILVFSYDEEIGCIGIQEMRETLPQELGSARLCIVGEPTEMHVTIGHKGKSAYRALCTGEAGHSALAPLFQNALYVAADFTKSLQELQETYKSSGQLDAAYDIPYTTFHIGKLNGGIALNIVPDRAQILFESRYLAQDGSAKVHNDIQAIITRLNDIYTGNAIRCETVFAYPGLDMDDRTEATQFAQKLMGNHALSKVAFGTEAGIFAELGIPTLVCGPGSMTGQGHKPDEYITLEQLMTCEAALFRCVESLT